MKRHLITLAIALSGLTLLNGTVLGEESKQEGKIFGKAYFSYSHDFSAVERGAGSGQTNGFDFTRTYLGYDRDLSDKFSIRFLLDADYSKEYTLDSLITTENFIVVQDSLPNDPSAGLYSDTMTTTTKTYNMKESKRTMRAFVKNAYLSMNCKLIPGSKWYFGMIGMPFVGVPENHWGYRSLHQLAMDKQEWGSTADLGIGWRGMWNDMFQLEFAATNGAGYKNPEADMFKLFELRPTAFLLEKALTLSVFGSFETMMRSSDKTISGNADAIIFAVMGGYDHKYFRVGGEYSLRSFSDSTKVKVGTDIAYTTESQNNISVWAHVKPMEKLTLLGRFDQYEPNSDMDNDIISALILGLDFHPTKNVRFIPNVQITMAEANNPLTTKVDEGESLNLAYFTFEYSW